MNRRPSSSRPEKTEMTVDAPAPDSEVRTPAAPPARVPAGLRPTLRLAAGHLLFVGALGLGADVLLEITWRRSNVVALVVDKPWVVLTGATVLALVAGVLLAVTGRRWFSAAVMLVVSALAGLASHLKFEVRREPLYPRDLVFALEPRFLVQMVQPAVLWKTALGLALIVGLVWGAARLLGRRPRTAGPRPTYRPRTILAVRVAVALTCLAVLSSVAAFNRPGNPWRGAFEAAGVVWKPANQAANYRANSFVGGFLFNLDRPAMVRPRGYSRATMEQIVARYTAAADGHNASVTGTLEGVNVVAVLAESLSDLTRLDGMSLGEDPLRRTRALMERLPHGRMLASKIGGGTSAAEFEVLTSMSLAQFDPAMDTPYQMLVPQHRTFPSAVRLFDELGHTGVAIHPYLETLYSRHRVYPALGFDDFVARGDMLFDQRLGRKGFISDASAFRQTLHTIASQEEPVFVNLVTMQNHTPYEGKYPEPVPVSGVDRESAEIVGQYAAGLVRTDAAIERFIRRLGHTDEKTIVVVYGDHLPGALPEDVFAANSQRTLHETPFFMYSNYEDLPAVELPTTSPIYFLPRIFDLAGAPIPPYYALLRELEGHVAAMEHGQMLTPLGWSTSPERLSPEAREVLRDYRLVQYDLAVGERYAEALFHPAARGTVAASGAGE